MGGLLEENLTKGGGVFGGNSSSKATVPRSLLLKGAKGKICFPSLFLVHCGIGALQHQH
jgi:hypothetical protein